MKKILFIWLLWAIFWGSAKAQDYFIKAVNIDQTSSETGIGIIAEEDGYVIGCAAGFFNSTLGGVGILKTDLQGNKVWENAFHDYPNESGIGNFSKLADNNYLITGGTYKPGLSWQDTFIKVGSNGDSLHTTYFGDSLRNRVAFSTLDNYGNHIVFSTYGIINQYSHNILLKLDTAGQVTHTYPIADVQGYPYQYSEEMIVLPNGEYVLTIAAQDDVTDMLGFIRKVDTTGITIWEHQLNDVTDVGNLTMELALLQNGNFVTAWYEAINAQTAPWGSNSIRCYNEAGDSLWQYTFWSTDYVRNIQALSVCANGDIICCGHTTDYSITGTFTCWMARLSADGELKWIREYVWWEAAEQVMFLYDLDEDPYGDIVATGFAARPNDEGIMEGQVALLKVNSEGCLSVDCNDTIIVHSFTSIAPAVAPPVRGDYKAFAVLYDPLAARLHLVAADLGLVGTYINHFTLYDLSGRVVATQALMPHQADHQIDLSALPVGIYAYAFADRLGGVVQRGKVAVVF